MLFGYYCDVEDTWKPEEISKQIRKIVETTSPSYNGKLLILKGRNSAKTLKKAEKTHDFLILKTKNEQFKFTF